MVTNKSKRFVLQALWIGVFLLLQGGLARADDVVLKMFPPNGCPNDGVNSGVLSWDSKTDLKCQNNVTASANGDLSVKSLVIPSGGTVDADLVKLFVALKSLNCAADEAIAKTAAGLSCVKIAPAKKSCVDANGVAQPSGAVWAATCASGTSGTITYLCNDGVVTENSATACSATPADCVGGHPHNSAWTGICPCGQSGAVSYLCSNGVITNNASAICQ